MPIRGDQVLAAAVLEEITQVAHGFTQRQVLAHNGTNWLLADASDQATRARGVVVEVIDANTFVIGFDGLYDEEVAHGLTVGEDYYLSTTPGALTLVQDGIIQHILTVVSATAYLLKLFYPYKPGLYPTPAGRVALTADVDDLALISYPSSAVQFYIDPDADGWVINSIVSDAKTRLIRLTNVDTVFGFVIADEGTGTAANRVITGQGGPVTVPPLATAILVYDVADSRWRLDTVASGAAGGFPEAIGYMGW